MILNLKITLCLFVVTTSSSPNCCCCPNSISISRRKILILAAVE